MRAVVSSAGRGDADSLSSSLSCHHSSQCADAFRLYSCRGTGAQRTVGNTGSRTWKAGWLNCLATVPHGYVAVTIADDQPPATATVNAQQVPGEPGPATLNEISGLTVHRS